MRIISGKYKGRILKGYDIIGTRPTMDRVKESLFGIIQNNLKASICLDLFAGSGSLGLEALSNGASICYFVDKNNKAIDILENNIKSLNIEEEYYLIKMDFKQALRKFETDKLKFDLIFLDPPYQEGLISESLKYILEYDLITSNSLVICEYEGECIISNGYTLYKERNYGNKNIKIFKKAH